MHPRVRAIHVSPVKSLRLRAVPEARLEPEGIPGDRSFVVFDANNQIVTQRKVGALARAWSEWDFETGELTIGIDGQQIRGRPELGERRTTLLWGRYVRGRRAGGPWSDALSELAGQPLSLVLCDRESDARDAYPVSLLSAAACDQLAGQAGIESVDPRRFRPTLLIEGCPSHEEDSWVGGAVRAGEAELEIAERDARCVLTTRNPDTGTPDLDTLRLIAGYRTPHDGEICFGVYANVRRPGLVRAGDPVHPI